jgi:hypothetical protein
MPLDTAVVARRGSILSEIETKILMKIGGEFREQLPAARSMLCVGSMFMQLIELTTEVPKAAKLYIREIPASSFRTSIGVVGGVRPVSRKGPSVYIADLMQSKGEWTYR